MKRALDVVLSFFVFDTSMYQCIVSRYYFVGIIKLILREFIWRVLNKKQIKVKSEDLY